MSQKLEDRLLLYERDHPIRNDQELIAALEVVLAEQDSLPIKKRDFDLIAEATETVLKLQGYSEEQLAEMADEAVSSLKARLASQQDTPIAKPKARRRVLKWLIPIVTIIVLSTAVVASSVNSLTVADLTKRFLMLLEPRTKHSEENVDLVLSKDIISFTSFDELTEYSMQSLLLPYDIEDELSNLSINSIDFGESQHIEVIFSYRDTMGWINISYPISSSASFDYNATIGSYNVLLSEYDNSFQAVWNNESVNYCVKSGSSDVTKTIINNMRQK